MTQELLFDFPKFKITKKIRLIELFGGIGSQAMALRDLGADFEHYKLIEFDKYAVASYNAIHNTQHTTHDIRQTHASDLKITDTDKYCYLMTYSFPCTDLSVAGKMQGMSKADWEKGNSTRSGLLWEVERILKECTELPQVLLMENVPQVHADANKQDFENWLAFLRSKGYINHYQDLNAKDYGIPQNRDRCFCISILSKEFIDYDFPRPIPLTSVMRDYLEEKVDEKYYIKNEKANKLIKQLIESGVLPEQNRTEQNRTEQNRTEQNRTEQNRTEQNRTALHLKQTLSITGMANDNPKYQVQYEMTDCASTLLARDYKGPANFVKMNGVIEQFISEDLGERH